MYNQKLTEVILPTSGAEFLIRVDLASPVIAALLENAFSEYDYYYLLDVFDHAYELTNLSEEQLDQFSEIGRAHV